MVAYIILLSTCLSVLPSIRSFGVGINYVPRWNAVALESEIADMLSTVWDLASCYENLMH